MKAIATLLLLQLSQYSYSQKLTFDIFLFGNVIGQSVVEKKQVNDSLFNYTLHSSSEARIFFTVRTNRLDYDITYSNQKLVTSSSANVRNDEQHYVTVKFEGASYLIKRDNESFCLKPPIECSSVLLLFAEPCNVRQIFSERLGEYRPVKKTAAAEYEVDMKDGIVYIYRYKNGKLAELEMKKGFMGSVFMRPHKS